MLSDIILKFQMEETDEIIGSIIGFTTEMGPFSEDVFLTMGGIELNIDDMTYDLITRKMTIQSTLLCEDKETAEKLREEVMDMLVGSDHNVFEIDLEEFCEE